MVRIELQRVPLGSSRRRRRPRWAPALGLILAIAASAPAAAAESGTVPATVTVEQSIACLLVDGRYDFGSQPFAAVNAAPEPHRSATTAGLTSCGNQTQDVLVHGTNAAGDAIPPAAWQLTAGSVSAPCQIDAFGVAVSLADVANSPRQAISVLDSPFTSLLPNVALDAAADIHMPCTGSGGVGETMTFSVVYTAIASAVVAGPFEVEPNNDTATAAALVLDSNLEASIYGAISPIGDLDIYSITLPEGAVTIETFDASGNATCAGIDTIVRLINNANTVVSQDDDAGLDQCSLVTTPVAQGGVFYIEVTDYANDSVIPGYRLRVSGS